MEAEEPSLIRYRALRDSNPELFENPPGCLTKILFDADEIRRAKAEVLAERTAAGWPTDDMRIGVLAEDPYIGYVIRDAVRFSDGKAGLYNRVVASGGIAVLPILPDGNIALIRIFRHPARRWFLEAPQGLVLPGHVPAEEARKEMMEEMGAAVDELSPLGVVYTSTAMTSENLKMFAAQIRSFGAPQRSEGIESIATIARADIDGLVLDGTICDGATIALILRSRIRGLL